MNKNFTGKSVFSLSLATVTLLSGGLSSSPVSAQIIEETHDKFVPSNQASSQPESTDDEYFIPSFSNQASPEVLTSETGIQASQNLAPVPGTAATSSASLNHKSSSVKTQYPQANFKPSTSSDVAQADIDFGGSTRGGSSYVGIAGNIGLGGDSALGDGNFMIISKVGLTSILSTRPSVVLGDETVILVPVTYDFSLRQTTDPFREPLPFSPYVGAGLAIETGDDSELSFMLTGGVDVPLNDRFTATAAVNAAFFDDTDLGLSVGVGYNFGGF